jgi:hypothetical protein
MRDIPNVRNGTASMRKPIVNAAAAPPGDNDLFLQPWRASVAAIMSAIRDTLNMRCKSCIADSLTNPLLG